MFKRVIGILLMLCCLTIPAAAEEACKPLTALLQAPYDGPLVLDIYQQQEQGVQLMESLDADGWKYLLDGIMTERVADREDISTVWEYQIVNYFFPSVYGSELNNLWEPLRFLITPDGYIRRMDYRGGELQISAECYRIIQFAQLREKLGGLSSEDAFGRRRHPFYTGREQATVSTGISFDEKSQAPGFVQLGTVVKGKTLADIVKEEQWDERPMSYDARRAAMPSDTLLPLSNGEFIKDQHITNLVMPSSYTPHTNYDFYDAQGNKARTIDAYVQIKDTAVIDGCPYWEIFNDDTALTTRVTFSKPPFERISEFYLDGHRVTGLPKMLPNGVLEAELDLGKAYRDIYCRDNRRYWLKYGERFYAVEHELSKSFFLEAGEYKIFLDQRRDHIGIVYFTKDDVHMMPVKIPDEFGNIFRVITRLKHDIKASMYTIPATGEDVYIWQAKDKRNNNQEVWLQFNIADLDRAWDAYVQNSPVIVLNNRILSFENRPVMRDGTTFLPLRHLFEEMGGIVTWDYDTCTATVCANGHTVVVQNDNNMALIDGVVYGMEQPPYVEDGRTMVPLRFLSEALGYHVIWDGEHQVIFIHDDRIHPGDPAAIARKTDVATYINGEAVNNYMINGCTYVSIGVLNSFGWATQSNDFYANTDHDRSLWPTDYRSKYQWQPDTGPKETTAIRPYKQVYLNGIAIEAYEVNGETMIQMEELAQVGTFSWDEKAQTVFVDLPEVP